MKSVKRAVLNRIAPLVAVATLSMACGAVQPDALAVGDHSISRDGLNDLVLAVNNVDPESEDAPTTVNIAQVQQIGTIWLQLAAAEEYLESQGQQFDDQAREDAKVVIEASISEGSLAPVDRNSEAFEALLLSQWTSTKRDELNTQEAIDALRVRLEDAEVDSRIGTWNPELTQIEPN